MKQAILAAALVLLPVVAMAQSPRSEQSALAAGLAENLSGALARIDDLTAKNKALQAQVDDLTAKLKGEPKVAKAPK